MRHRAVPVERHARDTMHQGLFLFLTNHMYEQTDSCNTAGCIKNIFLYCDIVPPHFAFSIFRASEELAVKLGEKVGGS